MPSLFLRLSLSVATVSILVPDGRAFAAAEVLQATSVVLSQAESQARAEHKDILLSFGASWCGNCHLFTKFLNDEAISPIMSRNFILTEVVSGEHEGDTKHSNNPGALQLQTTLGGKETGWPYFAILDSNGKMIIDSMRPANGKPRADNIGYPVLPEEIDWFMHMLSVAAPKITPQEAATIRTWLTDRAKAFKH